MITDRASGQSAAGDPRQPMRSAIQRIRPCQPAATKASSRPAASGIASGAQMPQAAKPSSSARAFSRGAMSAPAAHVRSRGPHSAAAG